MSEDKKAKVETKKDEKVKTKKAKEAKVETKKEEKVAKVEKSEAKKEEKKVKVKATPKAKKEEKAPKAKKEKKVLTAEEKAALKETKKTNRKLWLEKNKAALAVGFISIVLLAILGTALTVYFLNDGSRAAVTYKGGKVTKEVFETYYKILAPQYTLYYGENANEDQIKQIVANKVGTDMYLIEKAKKEGIKATKEEIAEVNKQFEDKEFVAQLTERGIDINLLKELFVNDLLIPKYIEKQEAKITDAEIDKLIAEKYKDQDMNKYMTRHILFKTVDDENKQLDASKKNEIKIKAQAVLTRALAGEDFAALAKEFSDDASGQNGGIIEMLNDGSIVKEYTDAVLKLKEGQVCATLVESQFGYHIIKLDTKVANGRRESLKGEIMEDWYSKLEEEAGVNFKANVIAEVKSEVK